MQLIQLQDNLTYCLYMLDDHIVDVITLSKLNGNVSSVHGEMLQQEVECELYCCYKRDEYPKVINL